MRLILAPMDGVIDATMRALLTDLGGIDRCVTEFVRVNQQLLPPRVFRRLCPELDSGGRTPAGVPVFVQLLGGQPSPMADNAARCAELGAPGIDLNFGCPAKTVNKSDGGAILLREPERVGSIVAAVRQAVPASIPVSAKIRLGFEDRSQFLDNVLAIAAAGASEIAIHARTRRDGYQPPAWWDEIARAVERVTLPVVANGEIWSPEDARRCQLASQCRDLMLGRGALCRPDLPRLVRAAFDGAPAEAMPWLDIAVLLQNFFRRKRVECEPRHAAGTLKQWLGYLRHSYPEAALLFVGIKRLTDPVAVSATIDAHLASLQPGRDQPAAA
ncbi:tRNA-dihydrouridine synthase [Haliea sp. E1-2-M8]|uniref:tRNA dihydrouridine synthase n=1 Tax=Haliea sp. E1-2-M8 TaxID=3064706 RepID=UPI0027171D7B|nr:tRNA-dihydrouridine synthase [Haliea sp. E1-2-M8]MDO8861260.1 tRNA-dihydrouridine synthase [Haliea sp. E1-2-M8]